MNRLVKVCRKVAFAGLLALPAVVLGQVPSVVMSSNQTVVATLPNPYLSSGAYADTMHLGINSVGTLLYVNGGDATLYALPSGSSTPVALVTNLGGYTSGSGQRLGGHGAAIDKNNNVYTLNTYNNGNGGIIEIPFVNETYPTAAMPNTLSNTNPPVCSSNPTEVCAIASEAGGSVTGYYLQANDIGVDAAGNLYVVDVNDNDSHGANDKILEIPASQVNVGPPPNSVQPALLVIASNLPPIGSGNGQAYKARIAVDSLGDVYYLDGTNVYSFPVGTKDQTSGFTTVGTGLSSPSGAATDAQNNLYIADTGNARIVEIPYEHGALNPADQYVVGKLSSQPYDVAVDLSGHIFHSDYAAAQSSSINEMTLWSASFGSSTVGTATTATTLNFAFNAAGTPATIAALPTGGPFTIVSGGTCVAGTAQALGTSCSVDITYKPNTVGEQAGAVVLGNASGAPLLTGFLNGIGNGAGFTVDPGTMTAIGSGWQSPQGVAVDAAGNTYVADTKANTVSEYAPGANTPTATLGTGLSGPTSVAVDGAGDVYIGDAGNGRVVEVPVVGGALSNASQSVILTGLSGASGVAMDGAGNLYVADSGNSRVLRLLNIAGTPSASMQSTIGSGWQSPVAVAVDSAGNVYVADAADNSVSEVAAATQGKSPISSSLSAPSGVAVDPSGSVFIVDAGNQQVIKVPNENGVLNGNDAFPVAYEIKKPSGIALDTTGNLYITDSTDATVDQLVRAQGALPLGSFDVNSTSALEQLQISNSGNQTLTFGSPFYTATGNTADFAVVSSQSNACASGAALNVGFSCAVGASFTPLALGSFTDTLTLAGNIANVSTPQIILSGTGVNLPSAQLNLAVTSPSSGQPLIGEPVGITATLVPTSGSGQTPTGTVTFIVDGQEQDPITVSATGTATLTLSSINGGSHVVGAVYSGDSTFAGEAAKPLTFTMAQLSSAVTLSLTTPFLNPQSQIPGGQVTLTALVPQVGTLSPTGTVTFLDGTTSLGIAPIKPVTQCTGCAPVYQAVLITTTLPIGNYNVIASYSGDVNYNTSSSAGVPIYITAPTFLISPGVSEVGAGPGNPATVPIQLSSLSGFAGNVVFSCVKPPTGVTCSFNPPVYQMVATGAGSSNPSVNLVVAVDVPTPAPLPVLGSLRWAAPVTLAFLLFLPVGLRKRGVQLRSKSGVWNLLLLGAVMLGLMAGSIALSGCNPSLNLNTPTGASTVTVQAIGMPSSASNGSSNITTTTQVNLVVQ